MKSIAKEGIKYNFQVSGLSNCLGGGAIYKEKTERKIRGEFGNQEFAYRHVKCATGHRECQLATCVFKFAVLGKVWVLGKNMGVSSI